MIVTMIYGLPVLYGCYRIFDKWYFQKHDYLVSRTSHHLAQVQKQGELLPAFQKAKQDADEKYVGKWWLSQ